jgi:hypothetical protein
MGGRRARQGDGRKEGWAGEMGRKRAGWGDGRRGPG